MLSLSVATPPAPHTVSLLTQHKCSYTSMQRRILMRMMERAQERHPTPIATSVGGIAAYAAWRDGVMRDANEAVRIWVEESDTLYGAV